MSRKPGYTDREAARNGFRVGDWTVVPELNVIRRGSEETALEPRLMALLAYLAERPGEVAAKDTLLASVWQGVAASDESLAQAISKLRRHLGDDPERPAYIETIRKRGYRLTADVRPLAPLPSRRSNLRRAVPIAIAAALAMTLWYSRSPAPVAEPGIFSPQPLTSRPGRERDPAISPDGRYLVYSAEDDGGREQIFLHGIGSGSGDRQLTRQGGNRAPVFFPDGERIAFLRGDDGDCAVVLMTLIDGAERIGGSCRGNGYGDTAMSPEGNRVAFNAREDPAAPHAIYLLELANGIRRPLTLPAGDVWGDYDPAFTADGRALVFARSVSEGMQDLFRVEIADGRETRLTDDARNIFGIAVRDDRVYFGSNPNGSYEIRTVGTDGSAAGAVPIAAAGIVNPTLSADGTHLAFENMERAVTLTAIELGNGEATLLLEANADILHPDLSPANRRIVFSSNRSGYYEIWDADGGGGDLRRLTGFSAGFTAHPEYSPDGSLIAFDARPAGSSRIHVMHSDGSGLRALTPDGWNAYSPTWSTDGSELYFSAEADDSLQIFRLTLASGAFEPVTASGGIFGRMAEDGTLYHVRPAHDGLWSLHPGRGHEPEAMPDGPELADWGNWDLVGGRILFYDRATRSLMSLHPGDTASKHELPLPGPLPTADPALAVSPDGSRILVGVRARLESDIEWVTGLP